MAVVTRNHRSNKRDPRPDKNRPVDPSLKAKDAEAPDRGETLGRQNQEAREGRPGEAPDAGEGRSHHIEHEFTRGRSQS